MITEKKLTAAQLAVIMGILTLGSKLVGLIRTMLMANYYGTGYVKAAFTLSQDIPVMLFGALFSAVATAYMPIYSRKYELEGEPAANRFTSQALNLLFLVSAVSSLVGIFGSDFLARLIGYKFSEETVALTGFYLKVSFSFLFFNSTATLLEALLQYKNVFLPQILIGYGQTLCIIALTVISAHTSHYLLVFGVLLGCAFRAGGILILAWRQGFRYLCGYGRRNHDRQGNGRQDQELQKDAVHSTTGQAAREIIALSFPVFVGGSINQINALVDKLLAAGLSPEAVSALDYGNVFMTMLSTLTVMILVTIVYPRLTQARLTRDHDHFSAIAAQGMNVTMLISVPFTLGAMMYSDQVIQVVFERGSFDGASVAMTSPALFWYSAGLTFVAANALLVKIYYALGDVRTPVLCAAAGAVVNIGLDLLLVGPMEHGGLALASSCAAAVNSLLLWCFLRKNHREVRLRGTVEKAWAITLFSIIAVGASWMLYRFLDAHIWMPRMVLLALCVLAAVLIYWLLLCHSKIEEINLIRGLFDPLKKRARRRP